MAATDVHSSQPYSHTALLYCRLCGDSLKAGQRCRTCGGSRGQAPASSNMASFGRKSKGKGDPWVERYARGETNGDDDENTDTGPSSTSRNRLDWQSSLVRNATAFNLGVGMPSSISKDLKPSPTPSPLGSYASRPQQQRPTVLQEQQDTDILPPLSPTHQHLPHSPSQPLMEHPSGGPLSKVCGTVLDPESTRNKWACADCSVIFARDSTIYVPPASAVKPGHQAEEFFCKDCYTARYSLGDCATCSKPILGTTKEKGAFVKTTMGLIYHGTCFRCQNCNRGGGKPPLGDGTDIMLDLNGLPSCEDCFGSKPRTRVGVVQRPSHKQTLSASALSPSLGSAAAASGFPFNAQPQRPDLASTKRNSSYVGKHKMGATIAELSQRFGQVSTSGHGPGQSGTTGSPTQRPPSPSRSPQPRAAHFSRSNSNDGTAAARYDLGAFKSTNATGMTRSDSRVRSLSPAKLLDGQERSSSPVKVTEMGSEAGAGGDSARRGDSACGSARSSPAPTPRFPMPRNYEQAERIASAATSSASTSPPDHHPSSPPEPCTIPKEQGEPVEATMTCAICHQDAFHGPNGAANEEAFLVSLPLALSGGSGSPVELHAECFKCAVCERTIDGSKSFVRLDDSELSFAHPSCAPPATMSRSAVSTPPPSSHTPPSARTRTSTSHMHPTLRSLPRPSDGGSKREYVAVHSFVRRATSIAKKPTPTTSPNIDKNSRQFKSTSGAAPPTRSTLNVHRPGGRGVNPAAGMFSVPPATTTTTRRYGGMLSCAGCTGHLTSLESVPGPAGSVWHKKCLICRAEQQMQPYANKKKICGKQLDSFAKVRVDGEVRCASCFREGR